LGGRERQVRWYEVGQALRAWWKVDEAKLGMEEQMDESVKDWPEERETLAGHSERAGEI
jgi:hypothetical protein